MQLFSTNRQTKRSQLLDVYRGLAVLLMIVFHLCWDLRHFGFMNFSIYDPFWVYFRSLILTLFMTAIGWSSYLSVKRSSIHQRTVDQNTFFQKAYTGFIKRDAKLLIASSIISIATYLAVPNQWIYFGILHFIFIASLISRPLVIWPRVSGLIGCTILIIYHTTDWLLFPNAFYNITHYIPLPNRTLDIVFPFPWIGVILIGPLLGHFQCHKWLIPNHILGSVLAFMGRYALSIYLVHQVFLFAFVALLKMVLSS